MKKFIEKEVVTVNKVNGYLSRSASGLYMLTKFKPTLENVMGTNISDLYVFPGDPIGVKHLCPGAVKMVFNMKEDLDRLEIVDMKIGGEIDE